MLRFNERRNVWLASAWTAIVLVLVFINLPLILSVLPRLNVTSHLMGLKNPQSQAYGAVEMAINIRSRTGLLEYPGRTIHAKWTLAIESAEAFRQRRQAELTRVTAPRGPAGQRVEPLPPFATLQADSLAGTATLICGDDVQHVALTAEVIADWLIWLFPDADPQCLALEAEGVLETVDYHIQQNLQGAGAGLYGYRPATFSGRSSKGIHVRQRLWFPGIAMAAGIVLAIWALGVWAVLRWTKARA